MASCPKCGKTKIKKRKNGLKKCKRCGILPSSGIKQSQELANDSTRQE